jgi:hypothetical protein
MSCAIFLSCTPIYVFPEMKLRGLVPNSYIHVSVTNLYIPMFGPPNLLQQNRQVGNICFEFSVQCICTVRWFLMRDSFINSLWTSTGAEKLSSLFSNYFLCLLICVLYRDCEVLANCEIPACFYLKCGRGVYIYSPSVMAASRLSDSLYLTHTHTHTGSCWGFH